MGHTMMGARSFKKAAFNKSIVEPEGRSRKPGALLKSVRSYCPEERCPLGLPPMGKSSGSGLAAVVKPSSYR